MGDERTSSCQPLKFETTPSSLSVRGKSSEHSKTPVHRASSSETLALSLQGRLSRMETLLLRNQLLPTRSTAGVGYELLVSYRHHYLGLQDLSPLPDSLQLSL